MSTRTWNGSGEGCQCWDHDYDPDVLTATIHSFLLMAENLVAHGLKTVSLRLTILIQDSCFSLPPHSVPFPRGNILWGERTSTALMVPGFLSLVSWAGTRPVVAFTQGSGLLRSGVLQGAEDIVRPPRLLGPHPLAGRCAPGPCFD